ncbi:hypothetical protein ACJ41O_003695 [Fusarium nematophilum]
MASWLALIGVLKVFGDIQLCEAQSLTPFDLVTGPRVLASWQKNTETGQTATSVWDIGTYGKIPYAHSCGNKLSAPALGLDLEFETDDHGEGTLLVGGTRHEIDLYPERSGGISCWEKYTETHVLTECVIPLQSRRAKSVGPRPGSDMVMDCFRTGQGNDFFAAVSYPDEDQQRDFPEHGYHFTAFKEQGDKAAGEIEEEGPSEDHPGKGQLIKRSPRITIDRKTRLRSPLLVECDRTYYPKALPQTQRFGDEAQKWTRHKTLTDPQECHGTEENGLSCSTSKDEARTVTHTASVSFAANILGPTSAGLVAFGWIGGGYSVAHSRTTSESHGCTTSRNHTVCLKHWRQHQAYKLVANRGLYFGFT